jgi:hypothetical protein
LGSKLNTFTRSSMLVPLANTSDRPTDNIVHLFSDRSCVNEDHGFRVNTCLLLVLRQKTCPADNR